MTARTGRRHGLFRAAGVVAAGLAALLTVSACGGSSGGPLDTTSAAASGSAAGSAAAGGGKIVVGSADFPESQLLANIYAAALTKAGVEASTNPNIGSREVYIKAIQDGSIDLVPEYTGNLLQYFDPQATAVSADDVYAALQKALPASLIVLQKSAAEDKDAVVVTKATADANNLKSIADLAPVASTFVIGGPPEWDARPSGIPGLKDKYGLTFKEFKALSSGTLILNALTGDQVQAANLYTTDPAIPANDLVALDDPENLFIAQNVLPLIRSDANNAQVTAALNAVSAKLDTATLTELLTKVQVDKQDSGQVAQEWVAANLGS